MRSLTIESENRRGIHQHRGVDGRFTAPKIIQDEDLNTAMKSCPCGHTWAPILSVGSCPKCGTQAAPKKGPELGTDGWPARPRSVVELGRPELPEPGAFTVEPTRPLGGLHAVAAAEGYPVVFDLGGFMDEAANSRATLMVAAIRPLTKLSDGAERDWVSSIRLMNDVVEAYAVKLNGKVVCTVGFLRPMSEKGEHGVRGMLASENVRRCLVG